MGKISDAEAASGETGDDVEKGHEDDKVAGFDRNRREKQHDFQLRVAPAEGEEEPHRSARSTKNNIERPEKRGDQELNDSAPDNTAEEENEETFLSEIRRENPAKHPENEHIEKDMSEAARIVHEAIGEKLPWIEVSRL